MSRHSVISESASFVPASVEPERSMEVLEEALDRLDEAFGELLDRS
ncbi:MAG: hypothetical protein IIA63_05720 [Nitrospinae bacterium]|nr:hypothetical protein [Nitrospinota bacterium]